jgi:methionine-rich copper-binding protein CopC
MQHRLTILLRVALRGALVGAAAASVAVPAPVAAHAKLEASSPAAGANVTSPPSEVTITFTEELDPAASSFSVTDSGGAAVGTGSVDLLVADRNVLRGSVTISAAGIYRVSWSVKAADGHASSGTFSFGYNASNAIPGPASQAAPDTAYTRDGADLVSAGTLAGVILLIVACGWALRRVLR